MLRPGITRDEGCENLVMVISLIWAHMWPSLGRQTVCDQQISRACVAGVVWPTVATRSPLQFALVGLKKTKMIPTKVWMRTLCECMPNNVCIMALWFDLPRSGSISSAVAMGHENFKFEWETNFRNHAVFFEHEKNTLSSNIPNLKSTSWGTNDVIYDHVLLQMRLEDLNQKPVTVLWT